MSYPVTFGPTILQKTLPPLQGSPFLDRQAAQARLQKLTPGTEEYRQLQDALIKAIGLTEIRLPTTAYKVYPFSKDCKVLGGFGSSEHVAIATKVKLKLLEQTLLLVIGSAKIHFHHIVALAGDFYGVPGKAISLPGGSDEEKTERFENAFNTLAKAPEKEVSGILSQIEGECIAVTTSSLPHHCYSSQMIKKNNAIKNIKKDINELLVDNSDHFFKNAGEAYLIGHALALKEAQKAGQNNDLEGLKYAYALDAFACHFLTDLFAAGHIRNQRGQLETFLISQLTLSQDKAKKLAGILTGAQHEKDGSEGLNVSNQKGEKWRAYGDGSFFSPKNEENGKKALAATQASVDEIHTAYLNPNAHPVSVVNQLIPSALSFNPLPLYKVEGNCLYLYQGSNEIKIEKNEDSSDVVKNIGKIVSHALTYLPEDYVNGFLDSTIQEYLDDLVNKMIPSNVQDMIKTGMSLVDKTIRPQVERLTSSVWQSVGIASYHQIKQENQRLNAKIDEIADYSQTTCHNIIKIQKGIQNLDDQIKDLLWNNNCVSIKQYRQEIQLIQCKLKNFNDLTIEELKDESAKLYNAQIGIASVFLCATGNGNDLLQAHREMINKPETKIPTTLWFRHMLDDQAHVFAFYANLYIYIQTTSNEKNEEDVYKFLQKKINDFEDSIRQQIEANKAHIDETLIHMPLFYIELQEKKRERKKEELTDLKHLIDNIKEK